MVRQEDVKHLLNRQGYQYRRIEKNPGTKNVKKRRDTLILSHDGTLETIPEGKNPPGTPTLHYTYISNNTKYELPNIEIMAQNREERTDCTLRRRELNLEWLAVNHSLCAFPIYNCSLLFL